ncbi:hypothetical protein TI05_13500 [Achromatium sp. WMS3]|nr:hypothetical protein TI05_13500 [Achromatium sp. WMS3]
MKKLLVAAFALTFAGFATAASLDDMVGTWTWEGFTIEVAKCDATGVCATVTAGPKNVGMEMMKSKLAPQGDNAFVGRVAHPKTGQIYNSKMTLKTADAWHMTGCTNTGVCASGDFTRVK